MRFTRTWFGRALVAAGVVVSLAVPGQAALAAPTTAAAETPVVAAAAQWTWEWSDGSTQVRRTFSKRQYQYASNLPFLRVANNACYYGVKVKLQFKAPRGSVWYDESVRVTKGCKAVKLVLNPYTPSGVWARGEYQYRIIVSGSGGIAKYLTITYTR